MLTAFNNVKMKVHSLAFLYLQWKRALQSYPPPFFLGGGGGVIVSYYFIFFNANSCYVKNEVAAVLKRPKSFFLDRELQTLRKHLTLISQKILPSTYNIKCLWDLGVKSNLWKLTIFVVFFMFQKRKLLISHRPLYVKKRVKPFKFSTV